MTDKVFVYGTLRRTGVLSQTLGASEFLGNATIKGTLHNLGWYPAYIPEGDGSIFGEVYQVTPAVMGRLDFVEGYPELYGRKIVQTPYGDAWVYFMEKMPEHSRGVVESGDWMEYIHS